MATWFRRRTPTNALIAAATKLSIGPATPRARRREAWQERCWEVWEIVPQIRDAYDNHANLIARIPWFAAVKVDPLTDPLSLHDYLQRPDEFPLIDGLTPEVAATAISLVQRIEAPIGGQDAIKRELATNLGIPGEGYLCGWVDDEIGERWEVFSIDELQWLPGARASAGVPGRWQVRAYPGQHDGPMLPEDAIVIRCWDEHPRFSAQATSRLRSALDAIEELLLLWQGNRAVASSRIANAGVLLYDKDKLGTRTMDPSRSTVPQATDSPVFTKIAEAMMAAIGEPSSAAAVVPVAIGLSGNVSEAMQHITFDRPMDEHVLERCESLMHTISYALPLPIEKAEGLGGMNHWGGWQVEDSGFRTYLEPGVRLQVDGITDGWLQPGLVAAHGLSPEQVRKFCCWYDPTPVLARPNEISDVREGYRDGAVSGRRYREAIRVGESDAPDDAELERRAEFAAAMKGGDPASTTDTQSPPGMAASGRPAPGGAERLITSRGRHTRPRAVDRAY